jgi:hypothetical protein
MHESEGKLESELNQLKNLLCAVRTCLQKGGNYLVNRLTPNGPIMNERCLEYIHKSCWGMYGAGVDLKIIRRLLDWTEDNALRPNGDLYFSEEPLLYRNSQRAYRALTLLKIAAWTDHPLSTNKLVINRVLQYQHKSGGVFNYIGENPDKIEEQPSIGGLNTSFFGHLMVALDRKKEAFKAGEWIKRLVEANQDHILREGRMYTNVTPEGMLVTKVKKGEKYTKIVDNTNPKQEFWQVGTSMAYLAVLYDAMRQDWNYSKQDAQPFLKAALTLLNFEATMPLITYFWPSKCKVAWGAGELLRILVKYRGTEEQIEKASRIAKLVAVHTFMDHQLENGGWPPMHYPLSENEPALEYDYHPLYDLVNVPSHEISGSNTNFLPAEEITGEFLGEIKSVEVGISKQIEYYENRLK